MPSSPQIAKKIKAYFLKYPLSKFPKGEILIQAGDEPKHIFYLESGNVRQFDITTTGDEVVVNVFKPGAFFPMSWPVAKTPNRYFFQADTDVRIRRAKPPEALAFIKDNPDVMLDLLARLYSGVDGMQRRMAHLMGGSARSRLLYELIVECKRFGKKLPNSSYRIKINEAEIGARAGLARETVSREMKVLKQKKLISVDRLGIILKDLDLLERQLGPDL